MPRLSVSWDGKHIHDGGDSPSLRGARCMHDPPPIHVGRWWHWHRTFPSYSPRPPSFPKGIVTPVQPVPAHVIRPPRQRQTPPRCPMHCRHYSSPNVRHGRSPLRPCTHQRGANYPKPDPSLVTICWRGSVPGGGPWRRNVHGAPFHNDISPSTIGMRPLGRHGSGLPRPGHEPLIA
jgi:hypothetical protein